MKKDKVAYMTWPKDELEQQAYKQCMLCKVNTQGHYQNKGLHKVELKWTWF
jgi:hypothetical protein